VSYKQIKIPTYSAYTKPRILILINFFLACSSGLDRVKLNWDENYKNYLSILSLSKNQRTNLKQSYMSVTWKEKGVQLHK